MHLSCALHEFVVRLELLWTDMVAPPTEQVQAWPAPRTRLTAHTRLAVCRAPGNTFSLCVAGDQALGAHLLAFAQVKVESCSAARAEVLVEAGVTLQPALCACVSLWGARAVKAQRAGSHAHADLLHPDSLQMHEESRLAGQAAIVVGAGQTATLLAP